MCEWGISDVKILLLYFEHCRYALFENVMAGLMGETCWELLGIGLKIYLIKIVMNRSVIHFNP